jgi:hypothetical protein
LVVAVVNTMKVAVAVATTVAVLPMQPAAGGGSSYIGGVTGGATTSQLQL